ncbi:MAG TPA: hypothetical protein VLA16_26015 [Ideonella sp.]|jgi:hypothetical protein|nr:hypothetical protein [Ideonella sp.]
MTALKFAIYPLVCAACLALVACQPEDLQPERSAQSLEHALQQADVALDKLAKAGE